MSPSRFWSTEIKGTKGRGREVGDKGDHHRPSLAVNPHPPPVPLAYPTVISLWGAAQLCQQLSCLVPLIHFNIVVKASNSACHAGSLPLPSRLSKDMMKAWKYENALHRGLWRRQFPSCPCLFPMWRKITHFSDVPPHRTAVTLLLLQLTERVEQIGGVLNYWGGWHFFKLFICFTPLGYVIIATANPWIGLLAYSYILSYLLT